MNKRAEKNRNQRFRMPGWLREEWVWQGVLAILVVPTAVHTFLSLGVGQVA